jgi:hypothetical protein
MFDVLYVATGASEGQKLSSECGRQQRRAEDEGIQEQGEHLGE